MNGRIVAGALAPHPPHLVYAENPVQNEPKAECGWETLRWGYERLRDTLKRTPHDVIVVMSPHWRTYVGTHLLAHPRFKGLSVDPVFPHLFRYNYDMQVDVDLAKAIAAEGTSAGLPMKLMQNPDYRVDYGTIVACHMTNPSWDKPIVSVSSHASTAYFSPDVMNEEALRLGEITRRAIEKSGRRAVLLASCSLSHRHFTKEPPLPEDMSHEHIMHHGQYLWDMRMIDLMKKGKSREMVDLMPDFVEQAVSETDSGALTWMMSAMQFPTIPAEIHGYGTVIGTGNVIASWTPGDALASKTAGTPKTEARV